MVQYALMVERTFQVLDDELTAESAAPVLQTPLPGPLAAEVIARDEAVTSPSLTRLYPLVVRRARGLVIEDVDGNRFLDFNAGIAVAATGHCHPQVVAAIERQARALLHYCSSDWYVPAYTDLCERLAASAPMRGATRVFLGNSGTEAVEGAIKLARRWGSLHKAGAHEIITLHDAFHGRTLATMSASGKPGWDRLFAPQVPGFPKATLNDLDSVVCTIEAELSAPVRGPRSDR